MTDEESVDIVEIIEELEKLIIELEADLAAETLLEEDEITEEDEEEEDAKIILELLEEEEEPI